MSYYQHPERLDPIKRGGNGGVKFGVDWFESVVKRIEHIKPVAVGQDNNTQTGARPIIEVIDRAGGDGREIKLNASKVTLNVCSNGVPSTITILATE